MEFNLNGLLMPLVVVCIFLVVVMTELIKKLDKKDRLKGYRVYIPVVVSLVMAAFLAFGEVIVFYAIPFYWAVIFGFSVFGYEAILKKIQEKLHGDKDDA